MRKNKALKLALITAVSGSVAAFAPSANATASIPAPRIEAPVTTPYALYDVFNCDKSPEMVWCK